MDHSSRPLEGLAFIGLPPGPTGQGGKGFLVSLFGALLTIVAFASSPTLWLLAAALVASSQSNASNSFGANRMTAATVAPSPTTVAPVQSAGESRTEKKKISEVFEGAWVKAKAECADREGPNSRTTIDLGNIVDGKKMPILDRYENHCLISQTKVSGTDVTLSTTCYEFWEELTKHQRGQQTVIKLSTRKDGRLLIDGVRYERCPAGR